MRSQLAPAATHAAAAETRPHRAHPGLRQLSQHPPRSAAAFQQRKRQRHSTTAQAHHDDARRRREPHRAALSTAREAQSMRIIASGQQPRESRSLSMRAPPRAAPLALAPHHDGAPAASRDDERGSRRPRPSMWTAARARRRRRDVIPCFGAHAAAPCYPSALGADDPSGPRSLCGRAKKSELLMNTLS